MNLQKDTQSLSLKTLVPRALKFAAEGGLVSGYLSTFGGVDSYGDTVTPGAFKASLAAIRQSGRPLPMLWQHRADDAIGRWDVLREDDRGLYGEGQLLVGNVAKAREVHALLLAEVASGISIGFVEKSSTVDKQSGIRTLTEVDLKEASIVVFPANDAARVVEVRQLQSRAELEDILHRTGLPRAAARKLAGGGWPALVGGEEPALEADPALEILSRKLAAAIRDVKSLNRT